MGPRDRAPPRCLFCDKPERAEVFEIWDHEMMFETCCEGMHEQIVSDMNDDPDWARQFLRHLDVEALCGRELRRVTDDGACGMILDWKLELRPIAHGEVRAFIDRHHAHCRAPQVWRFYTSVWNGRTLLGVAVVGNPVARAFNARGIVEVNRLCIRRDTAAALRWNAASMLYGWCAREAESQGWSKIITYTRTDEEGTSLKAAGWLRESRIRGRGWHNARRARSNLNGWIDKWRWSRALRPKPHSAPSRQSATHPHSTPDYLFGG